MMAMTKTIACALGLLLVNACGALAQDKAAPPFKASHYPTEVRKSLSNAVLNCRQEDNGKVEFAPDTVRRIDFNGDGRDDYVVSFADTKCSSFETVFCGTGGCMIEFLVTMPNGSVRSLFTDQVHKYEILPGKGKVRFFIHHSYCEREWPQGCFRDVRITDKPFSPNDTPATLGTVSYPNHPIMGLVNSFDGGLLSVNS